MSPLPGLHDHHYHMLSVASGISDDLIRERGYRTLTHPDDVQDLGFTKRQARTAPVLALPLWDVHGQQTGWQIRPDTPRMLAGKVAKYEARAKTRAMLDVHPRVQALLGDPAVPLWITEGVRKGDSLVAHGAPCAIAFMAGVWGFTGTNEHGGKVILPDWKYVALNDRLVYVVFDSDLHTKPKVQEALDGLYNMLRHRTAIPCLAQWPPEFQQKKWGVDDFLADGHSLDEVLAMFTPPGPLPQSPPRPAAAADPWRKALTTTKGGENRETFSNLSLALQHLPPWETECWYDVVREVPMCAYDPLSEAMIGEAALALERQIAIPIRTLRLVQAALVHQCRAKPRDLLRDWLESLEPWDKVERLTEWLHDHAGAPQTAYGMDVARLLPVSMVARALDPGCQYRNVVVFEGEENIGKSKLVKALASPEWYREVSTSLEGKEAHMIIQGAWVAELAELSSMGKTAEARLKSFITMENDDYVPKFSNLPVSRKRRTIFVATMNPEGDSTYFRSQTGNTRWLPIPVTDIQIEDVLAIRDQLFAEALVYYDKHPKDWWQLSSKGQTGAEEVREARRQGSIYEDSLAEWLAGQTHTTWEAIAQHYLLLEAKEKWKDKGLQMEIAKALKALKWERKQQWVGTRNIWTWFPTS